MKKRTTTAERRLSIDDQNTSAPGVDDGQLTLIEPQSGATKTISKRPRHHLQRRVPYYERKHW